MLHNSLKNDPQSNTDQLSHMLPEKACLTFLSRK